MAGIGLLDCIHGKRTDGIGQGGVLGWRRAHGVFSRTWRPHLDRIPAKRCKAVDFTTSRFSKPMARPRFFCPVPLRPHQALALPADPAYYAMRVRGLRDGAELVLFDGHGGEYDAVLRVQVKSAEALVGAHHYVEAELPGSITLVHGLPSGDKMDWIVEKAVELGWARLIPVTARRSVVQLSPEREAKRLKHWQRIAQSAIEQCGRNRLMQIDAPMPLEACLAALDATCPV